MSSRPSRGAARLAAILDALPDALLLVDTNGTVVAANRVALETFERPGAAVVGRGLLDLLPDFDPQLIPGSMRRPRGDSTGSVAPDAGMRAEERTKPLRMAARRTDGSGFPAEVTSADLEDGPGGESPYAPGHHYTGDELLMLVVRDLTGSAEIEAELHRQRRQTEMILRAAAEGIVGTDTTGKVVLVNPSAAQILGYRASELGGSDLHPLIHHSRPDGTPLPYEETPIADTLRSGRKHRVRGQVLWGSDGQPVPVDMTTAPVRDGDQLVGAVLAFTDRRRRDALEARLAQLQAVLAVALRSPLDTLRAELNTLVDDPAGQLWPEANQTLRHLSAGYGRMTALIDGVLDFQRLDSGKERLAVETVNVEDVVHAATEGADELIGPGRAQFVVHAPQLEIEADGRWLALALAHLIAEVAGVDATGQRTAGASDAPVVVAAARRGDVVRIEVQGPRGVGGSASGSAGSSGSSGSSGSRGAGGSVHEPLARGVALLHGGILQTHEVPGQNGGAYLLEVPGWRRSRGG
ncbi:PAS domain-containing protein, partial [Streptomyces phytophilus]|uniref:PAS domain-containing protein n=1 Tax=Streptomyces phytophilus TaxID=722715 RepID=UPI0015F07BA7